MQVCINYDGKTYEGRTDTVTKEEADKLIEHIYDSLPKLDRFQLELGDGGTLVIGKEAIQKAVFIFRKGSVI